MTGHDPHRHKYNRNTYALDIYIQITFLTEKQRAKKRLLSQVTEER